MTPLTGSMLSALLVTLASAGFAASPTANTASVPTGSTFAALPSPTGSATTTTTITTTTPVLLADTTTAPVATSDSTGPADDPGDLYALDLASGGLRRLTTDPRVDGAPAWTADGERLLFGRLVSGDDPAIGNADILTVSATGTDERGLIEGPARDLTPRPSPDGASVVFTSERDGNSEIYRLVVATGELRRLTSDPAEDRFPAFSPDGQHIVFTSDRGGDDDLYVMDVAGSDVRRRTATAGPDWLAEYSPDGASIAFATDHSIDVVDVDGTNRRTLTSDAGNHPSWAPDGRRIAAVTMTEAGGFAICTIEVSTGSITVLTDGESNDFYPAWSPDGDTIVFARSPRPG